jgi:hypothetical protein
MKIKKTASGNKVTISKREWLEIGRTANWASQSVDPKTFNPDKKWVGDQKERVLTDHERRDRSMGEFDKRTDQERQDEAKVKMIGALKDCGAKWEELPNGKIVVDFSGVTKDI